MFPIESVKSILSELFPYVNVSLWQFSSPDVYMLVALQPKDTFPNGYVENAKYARFSLTKEWEMKSFVESGVAKFRKTQIKDIKHFRDRMIKWKNDCESMVK